VGGRFGRAGEYTLMDGYLDRLTERQRATVTTWAGSVTITLIVSLQAVLLVPLYVRLIGPRLYGAWLGSGDILVWMQALDLGLPNLMIQRIGAAHGRGDSRAVGAYYASGMVVLAVVALALWLIALAGSIFLPTWMGLVGEEARTLRQCFVLGAAAAGLNIFNNSVIGFSRGVQDTTLVSIVGIASGLIGFGVSLGLVLAGWGLWAVSLGLISRALISLVGNAVFTMQVLRRGLTPHFRVRWSVLRELLLISPVTALGGVGYAVMNQSETALAAVLIRPEAAVIFSLTRRALDLARNVVDMIGVATYGSFAHLVSSEQRDRALRVYAQINSLRLSLAIALAAAYLAVNASLVSVWVDPSQYGGNLLTLAMAGRFVVVGSSYLINYLYRAAGPIMKGSIALIVETLVRVPLMVLLAVQLGWVGLPIAGILTAGAAAWIVHRWTVRQVAGFAKPVVGLNWKVWIGRGILVGIGGALGAAVYRPSWIYVLLVGSAVAGAGGLGLFLVDPLLRDLRTMVLAQIGRLDIARRFKRTESV
jgi:O-antigen/teichoic acid export membrane protein